MYILSKNLLFTDETLMYNIFIFELLDCLNTIFIYLLLFFRTINPTENKFVAWVAMGEGWHNYHHIFPWDYKAAELGDYRLNPSTAFLDFMAWIGQAYDLKTVSREMVKKRVQRTGDGSWKNHYDDQSNDVDDHHHDHKNSVWGWGDKDMNEEDKKDVRIFNCLKED